MMLQHFASGLSIFSGVLAVFLCVLLILQLAVHKQLAKEPSGRVQVPRDCPFAVLSLVYEDRRSII